MARKDRTMAVAEREPQTETEAPVEPQTDDTQTQGEETEAKRKRIDIEKLAAENPNEKVILQFHVPAGMRLQLRKNAEAADVSEAQYVRDMVAAQIGYAVPAEFNERKRRAGTLTEEEKKAQAEEKRQTVNAMLLAVQQNPEAAKLLAQMGIDTSKLPTPRGAKKGE